MEKRSIWLWIGVIVFIALVVYAIIPTTCWDLGIERKEAVTALIALAGVIGVVFTIRQTQKRITLQERQLERQEKQFNTQQEQFREQTEFQQKQQRDGRFASAVELLGNANESTRIGGAYSLFYLARDFKELRPTVCEILCAHIRKITSDKDYQDKFKEKPSIEVQTTIDIMFMEFERDTTLFNSNYRKNLNGVFLIGVNLGWMRIINNTNFSQATLINPDSYRATLKDVSFKGSLLTGVNFNEAKLLNVDFSNAKLVDIDFVKATLTDVESLHSTLSNVRFLGAALTNIYFQSAKLIDADFLGATLTNIDFEDVIFEGYKERVQYCFLKTCLEGYSLEDIRKSLCSLELTKPKDQNPQ